MRSRAAALIIISSATLLTDAEAAAAIWDKAAGKSVLAYDPEATLKINLIYDAREASARLGGAARGEAIALRMLPTCITAS